jgi:asparagine synthase (glutamine-hydrolysing)
MTDAMVHRGPDDRGTFEQPGIGLGVRRLSIVDVAHGHQPFASEDGVVVAVQNGELYNHETIRAWLSRKGHRFASHCDTEVLPHLYEEVGDAFAEHLRGKFGIAVWDARRRRVVLARDRLGVKPLYWSLAGDVVVFGSELKSLLLSGLVEPELDYEAIDAYLTLGFFPGPATPIAAVKKLEPGTRLIVDEHGARSATYWDYPHPAPDPSLTALEAEERVLDVLDEAVRLRLMSDVPLGAMLSGGLDSSLITALMARHLAAPVKTFAVGFAEAGAANELADARLVARALGTDHHELELSVNDSRIDLEDLVWHLDEPLADLSAVGFLALSELASQHVTVALSGQGADELFAGYTQYRATALAPKWARVPRVIARPLLVAAARGPARARRLARALATTDPVERLLQGRGYLTAEDRPTLARGPLAALDGSAAARIVMGRRAGVVSDPLSMSLYLDARLGLVDDMLHYFDRASMAHSLEVRVPFLDHELVELAAKIPPWLKVHRLTTKALLRRVARDLVPAPVIDKPKVGFFNAAVDAWFRSQASGMISDYLLTPTPRYAEFLDRAGVERLVRDHATGAARGGPLLAILMLEVWLSSFLPRAVKREPTSREHVRLTA